MIRSIFSRSLILATNYNDSAPYKKSVEDVSEETRYILEEFIIERAVEDGVDMSLVRPIIDVDLSACKIFVRVLKENLVCPSATISTNSTDCATIAYHW